MRDSRDGVVRLALRGCPTRGTGLSDSRLPPEVGQQQRGELGGGLVRDPVAHALQDLQPVLVPTQLVWSDGDAAVGRASVDACGRFVQGPYRLEVLQGVSHWIPDEAPAELAALLLPLLTQ